jgi:hypothetical protein
MCAFVNRRTHTRNPHFRKTKMVRLFRPFSVSDVTVACGAGALAAAWSVFFFSLCLARSRCPCVARAINGDQLAAMARGCQGGGEAARRGRGKKGEKKPRDGSSPPAAVPPARKWRGCREGPERDRGPREALNFFLALFFSCLRSLPAVVSVCSLSDVSLLSELWNRLHGRGRGGFQ